MINKDEYIAYSFDTSNIKYETEAGNLSRHTAKTLADLQNIVRGLEKTIRSSTGEKGFNINRNLISVDPSSETGNFRFFVKKEYEKIIDEAVRYFEGKAVDLLGDAKNPLSSTMHKENAHTITYQNRIAGTKAQNEMIIEANKAGGKAEKLGGIDDKMQVTLFVTDSDLKNKSETDILNETFSGSLALSDKELQTRKAKADLKQKANLENLESDFHTDPDELDTMVNKMMSKAETDEQKKKEEDERQKEKEETAHSQAVKSTLRKIVALLTGAVAILGKILSTAVDWTINATKTRIEAGNLEMTYEQLREKEILDISKNLPKGTHTGAYQDIQTAFGDITHLNQEALGTLGRVMGSGINTMVMSGMGADNPQGIAESILDSFFQQFLEGKNSLNEYVGQDTARRELVTVLKKISPNLATILSKMMDDWSSGRHEKSFTDYKGWTETSSYRTLPAPSPYDLRGASEAEKTIGDIKALLASVKDTYLAQILNLMRPLLQRIASLRLGMTYAEAEKDKEKAKLNNLEQINYLEKQKGKLGSEEKIKGRAELFKNLKDDDWLKQQRLITRNQKAKNLDEETKRFKLSQAGIWIDNKYTGKEFDKKYAEAEREAYLQLALLNSYDELIAERKDKKGNISTNWHFLDEENDIALAVRDEYRWALYDAVAKEYGLNNAYDLTPDKNYEQKQKLMAVDEHVDTAVFNTLARTHFNKSILPGLINDKIVKNINSVTYKSGKDDNYIHFTVNFTDNEGNKQTRNYDWNTGYDYKGNGVMDNNIDMAKERQSTGG